MMDAKALKVTIKLMFSSLFARRMPYLLFEEGSGTWYFTNVSPEELLVLVPNMTHVIHEVTFNNSEMKDSIVERFPILNRTGLIDTRKINSLLNKSKTPDNLQIRIRPNTAILELYDTADTEGVYECEDVGVLLEPDLLAKYREHVEFYLNRKQWTDDNRMATYVIDPAVMIRSGASMVTITNKPTDSLSAIYVVNIPIRDGLNIISANEYVKKMKCPGKLDIAVCYDNGKALKAVTRYRDDNINVTSVQLCAMWFPLKNTSTVVQMLHPSD